MSFAADEAWYTQQDGRRKYLPHCPIAAIDKCPRYYLSMQHAAAHKVLHFQLSEQERTQIESRWATSDVFVSMDLTVGSSPDKKNGCLRAIDGFCPEVSGRVFGLFCSSLHAFTDEEARRSSRQKLKEQGLGSEDPRWEWMAVEPRHYSGCHEFSVYALHVAKVVSTKNDRRSIPPKLRFSVLERDQWRCVYCGLTSEQSVLHVDHKVSRADGGDDSIENLVTACETCNLGKGAKSII